MAKGTTTQGGLGWSHVQARRQLPSPDGQPCPFCRLPMLPGQALDADHRVPRALGGTGELRWAHAKCNRKAGAHLGNRMRGRGPVRWQDRWS